MLPLITALILASLAISSAFTAVIIRVAPAIGFVDNPGGRKIHENPKPLGGGIAIFLAILIPVIAGLAFVHFGGGQSLLGLSLPAEHFAGIGAQTPLALKVLLALCLMHLLGLVDDRKALGPFVKLFIQLAIIAGLVVWADLRVLTALDSMGLGRLPSIMLTILWIGVITNAFNFLDNMDGLSAGVGAVAAAAFLITAVSIGQLFVAAMLALLLGALLGFLLFNFAPAKIFMGDAGSLLIGLLLGVLTVRTTYLSKPLALGWYEVLAPAIVLAVPLYDLLVVSAIRIKNGRSPFVGDKNHLSHRLVERGMSRRTAVLCIYLMTAATSSAAIILPHTQTRLAAAMCFAQTLLVLGLVMLLERHPLPMEKRE